MDKKQRAQNPSKGSVTQEQEEKLDELAGKISRLPNRRKKMFESLMNKKLLDSKEVCEILGVSLPTLRRWIARNEIKFIRVCRYIRFPSEEIFRLVENQEALGVPEVAQILGVGVLSVRNIIKRGEIKAFRMSDAGHYHIPRAEVERIIKGEK